MQIKLDNVVVRTITVQDVTLGSHVVTDLNHDATYKFLASLVNAAGLSASYTGEATTTIGKRMESIPLLPSLLSNLLTENQNDITCIL